MNPTDPHLQTHWILDEQIYPICGRAFVGVHISAVLWPGDVPAPAPTHASGAKEGER